MNLVARAQGILIKPKDEWVKIKDEPTTVQQLFTQYAVILAAIPAVAQFIGTALFIGFRIPGGGGSWMARAFFYAVFSYILNLAAVYALGFIINALAPNFSSTQDLTKAMKLSVYSMTPAWIAGIFHLIPSLWVLSLLGSLYGLYILYLGFNMPLMGTPKEKTTGYFVISLVVAVVLMVVIGLILQAAFAIRGIMTVF
ncbi:MAG: YIP1 family protein [Candidatus Aminicenantes bacterium]|nr:YIP1 family protein [Candidatus Aminicenantes bacterium]